MNQSAIERLDRSAVARYLQLLSLFRHRIETGEWRVGAQIPTLDKLTEEFGVAIATVRRALAGLAGEGLISRRPAKGTFVLRRPSEPLWREITIDGDGGLRIEGGATTRLINSRVVEAPPLQPHAAPLLSPYRWLRRVYSRDTRPFLINDYHIHTTLVSHLRPAALAKMGGQELADSIARAVDGVVLQTLTIGAADMATAEYLNIALNAPVAHVARSLLKADGTLAAVSIGVYRGDVVRLDFRQSAKGQKRGEKK